MRREELWNVGMQMMAPTVIPGTIDARELHSDTQRQLTELVSGGPPVEIMDVDDDENDVSARTPGEPEPEHTEEDNLPEKTVIRMKNQQFNRMLNKHRDGSGNSTSKSNTRNTTGAGFYATGSFIIDQRTITNKKNGRLYRFC